MDKSYEQLRKSDLTTVRQAIRQASYEAHTAGLGDGYLQTNLAIMPEAYALDFMRYCQRNPKPCPLVGVSDTGNPMMFTLGGDIDIRTDVPSYNIYRHGVLDGSVRDLGDIWQDDFVAFALGCSFTFERALQEAGISLWHIDNNVTVPMYRTKIQTMPAGPFHGDMVVSMRMIDREQVSRATEISRQFPWAHGAPVHAGDPEAIGIADLTRPDWGAPVPLNDNQVPMFWACGVTPQVAVEAAKLPIFVSHKPGCMLITDVSDVAEIPNYQEN
ncbi:MAG: putative hydro-lyase [Arenibacterium sp.]